ncbi:toll/interleukin-1 receptor domain-containing protein [Staphylococcus gallinarum]|uniref:toll/interleukin-1 receptor domain-containing protein n=1 Tax=Staphylococcus gallinarum TaxID=1293 RepID=UPI001E2A2777|nr:toll/interleukin-1 receptor domain-containing protein [Staphylococcus gallinarum]MCD8844317.1 toll/interleukin-1 receptor domain-containing protein [Staphylococcus gallinarum]
MEERYKINLDDSNIRNKIAKYTKKEEKTKFPTIFQSIIKHLSDENYTVFDAQEVMDSHFTERKYDIFISHSHSDIEYVKKLAGYYEEQGKLVFIDSEYWNFSDDLLKALDNEFSYQKKSGTYSYEKRNITTTIVHNLLAVSLEKMIDRCEKFIFAYSNNTSGSNIHELLKTAHSSNKYVISPWIYKEVITANIIYKNKREIIEKTHEKRERILNESPIFLYEISELIKDYIELNTNSLELIL